MKWHVLTGVALVTVMVLTGCGGKKKPAGASRPVTVEPPGLVAPKSMRPAVAPRGTLYERLGGESVVRAAVEDCVTRAAADPAVNFTRAGTPNAWEATPQNLERLKQRLVEYISTVAGGPLQYQGKDMVSAHKGMAISNSEFAALARHLRAALETHNVPRREREELMEIFAGARGAIVEIPDAPTDKAPQLNAPAPDAPAPESVQCPPSS